ncbi:Aspartyl/glutamyl-tRNA(Asn/Gln) amidotransferase subunit B [Methanimicrococcus hongohii]|uniref:Aspartyl/glutamyl-tRNA(Asn/Gln) amidotransferase subunit B n=1 Tax=Methanimicrococcus hongohii TaxID=3028295 RepID=A0AA96V0A4_9EURY|nr:Asp-tRNA(Asn)/Glu-tRNA(Gln) amidotransferase subunit GatB [Methanimicrococcus sp. Hf6]WNY23997.1 Aspartyl/glutamyl-tRNA(Asn/Gln) amidotransferase subunit B [Methanimicrococcus sp. Hf6]
MVYENPDGVMVGLEVHVQLNKANTKMFCSCTSNYTDEGANTCLCPGCLALPGTTPVLNEKSVDYAIKIGLALNAEIENENDFFMKSYFYPDLGNGYQVTQFDKPIVKDGYIVIEGEDGELKVRIRRAHMEDDPGKMAHFGSIDKSTGSIIDFNRSGMPLVEIVSDPDMRSAKEARRFLDKLRSILEYLDVFDGSREGAMKADANISVNIFNGKKIEGTRVEVKNISSHKAVEKAINYEIMRQKDFLRKNKPLIQETRHYDEDRNVTISLRAKETADDYRYFPDFDLVPMIVGDRVDGIRATMPELPDAKRERFVRDYGISDAHAKSLVTERAFADLFESVAAKADAKLAASWTADIVKGELNYRDMPVTSISADDILAVIEMVSKKEISEESGVIVIRTLLDEGGKPADIVKAKGLAMVADDFIATAAKEAIAESPDAVADYKAGTEKALNFIVGKVMQKAKGKADARLAREMVLKELEKM